MAWNTERDDETRKYFTSTFDLDGMKLMICILSSRQLSYSLGGGDYDPLNSEITHYPHKFHSAILTVNGEKTKLEDKCTSPLVKKYYKLAVKQHEKELETHRKTLDLESNPDSYIKYNDLEANNYCIWNGRVVQKMEYPGRFKFIRNTNPEDKEDYKIIRDPDKCDSIVTYDGIIHNEIAYL